VQSVLGSSLSAAKGWSAPELEPVYARAPELCAQIRDPVLAFPALYGQWAIRWWKLELHDALELADEILASAEKVKAPKMLLAGNFARGITVIYLGELVSANEHLEKALAIFDLRQSLGSLELYRVSAYGYLYLGLFWLGYPDRAWEVSREMLEVAQRSSDPYALAATSCFAAQNNLFRGDGPGAQKHAEEAMALTEAFGFQSLSASATTYHGAALIAQGRYEEGIAGLRRGFSAWRATGGTPHAGHLCLLASGLGEAGRPQEGLEVVEEGLASVAKTGEQIASPSLHHVKGELLLAQNPSDVAEAEQCFRAASEIARRQSARSIELRATTSLARVLNEQGCRDEARTMLAEIYGWFTEGFDTRDLKNAKALLEQLNA
jgi:predicted ATPase